jgi:hypothetical protein
MKKWISLLLALTCLFSLTGCAESYPAQAADGTAWDESWTILGKTLGVEDPGNGLTLLENPVVLTGDDTHYATWTIGEPSTYINEDEDETDLYPAQLYLLLYGCADHASAETAVSDWMEREEETYTVLETVTETYNGQEYTLLIYQCGSETNPYSRGVAAFGVYETYAVSAEITCVDTFDGDEQSILADFLNGCHYSAEQ